MEVLITEPLSFPSLSTTNCYYRESTGHSSKEAECNSSENKPYQVQLRTHKAVDIDYRQHGIPTLITPATTTNTASLTTDESSVMIIDKTNHHLSSIPDEQLEHFPSTTPISRKSSLYQAACFAHHHRHICNRIRFSFYDNLQASFEYLSKPLTVADGSPTSISSNDDKDSSINRKDSNMDANNVQHQTDSILLAKNSNRTLTSSSSSNSNRTNTARLSTGDQMRVKWHSFTKVHRPDFNSSKYYSEQMSVGQLSTLRRMAVMHIQELFDVTRIFSRDKPILIERRVPSRQCLLAAAFSVVPKLIVRRRQQRKDIHYQIKNLVFGVSLLSMTQRTGHPVPIAIISAMKYIRDTSIKNVGIFRKPGVSHRIKHLHDLIESDLEFHQFDHFSPYDVSDILKQYFRSLPECLFTIKLSPLFLHINDHFSSVDKTSMKLNDEHRLRFLQYAILLLPDENRLVLHLLLSFLNDISKYSKTNQMSSTNLATCFAPTLFAFHDSNKLSPNSVLDLRDIHEQRKAMDTLAFMIDHVRLLFLIPNELHQACHFSYIEIGQPCTLEELAHHFSETIQSGSPMNKSSSNEHLISQYTKEISKTSASDSIGPLSLSCSSSLSENVLLNVNNNNDDNNGDFKLTKIKTNTSYQDFIDRCIIEVICESCYTKLRGWTSLDKTTNGLELAFKKLNDGYPLGLWKCSVEIGAPPIEILHRLLNERHLWDDDFQSGTIIETLNQNTHIYQYIINSMTPLASRYFCELRSWRTNIQLNINNNYQNNVVSTDFAVRSSITTSSNIIPSTISTMPNNQRREACILVCTSIEHLKGRCPSTLVRAVTLASRYLIQSYGCGKSKVTHLSRVDLMGRSYEWYSKVYGSILIRSMMKLRDSFVHRSVGPETNV